MAAAILSPHVERLNLATQEVFFDPHQFAGQRAHAVSKASHIAFEDYTRMHQTRRAVMRSRRFIPSFAADDSKLRRVLAVCAWRYAYQNRPFDEGASLNDLIRLTDSKLLRVTRTKFIEGACEVVRRGHERQRIVGRRGFFNTRAAIAYRSWRLGQTSPEIAQQLDMTAPQVRIILYRMNKIARELGYELFPAIHPNSARGLPSRLPPADTLITMYESKGCAAVMKRCQLSKCVVIAGYRRAKRASRT